MTNERMSDSSEVLKKDATAAVRISSDRMSAYLIVTPPLNGGNKITYEQAVNIVKDAGVTFGIMDDAISKAVSECSGSPQLIAKGDPSIPGKDAQIKFLFKESEKKVTPTILDDGSVDLRDISEIQNVEVGDKLIEKIPFELGTPGKMVTGMDLPPKRGKDFKLSSGRNARVSDDGIYVLATAPGRPAFRQKKVYVDPVYKVAGNVDYTTGNVDFIGSVLVRGWIKDGFSVKAGGDIEVDQGVDDAFLEANGNIHVKYGIQGGEKGRISAKGNVRAGYIYNALVFTEGDVNVRESIMHSKVYADKRVLVEGGKGLIVGGLVRAGELISARTIGSSLAQPTIIEVGINPAIREEVINLDQIIESKSKTYNQTNKAIDLLMGIKKSMGRLTPDKERMLIKLRHTLLQLGEELDEAKVRKSSLEELMNKVQNPKIKVSGKIFPGVKIVIRGSMLNVHDVLNCVVLYEQNKEIRVGPFR